MVKIVAAALTAFFMSASTLAHAQGPGPVQDLSPADLKAFTEMRIDLVKTALQLTPDQAKLWPAVEEAIRARAAARQERLANLAARLNDQRERSIIELLRERADALTRRGASLHKYVDAWQPLYQTLDANQKIRLRFAAAYLVHELRDAVASRLSQYADDEDYD
jgi:superfamily II RNA helicase